MADYRSKPYNYTDQDMKLERYNAQFDPKLRDSDPPRDFRSYTDQDMQLERCYARFDPKLPDSDPPLDFRSYNVLYPSSYKIPQNNLEIVVAGANNEWKLKKGKPTNGSMTKSWSFGDTEFQRKKRVAEYKVYTVEGKVFPENSKVVWEELL